VIGHMLDDQITVADNDGTDADGVQKFSNQRTLDARIEGDSIRQYDQHGELIQTKDAIMVDKPVDKDALVWLPGQDTTDGEVAETPDTVESASSFDGGLSLWKIEM